MTILDEIVANKKREVALQKKQQPLSVIRKKVLAISRKSRFIGKTKKLQLIAEVKAKSPSAGKIRSKINPKKLAKYFETHGATAISVLTDKKYFGGSLRTLSAVKKTVGLPVLRKEFIVDEYQLYESRYYKADVVLLIVAVLKNKIGNYVNRALELNLQPLIEVHTEAELKRVLKSIKPDGKIIIGINNRNLKTFKVNLNTSLNLIKLIPKKFIRISESGVFETHQLKILSKAGFDGVLVGTGLAKNPKLFEYFKQ